MNFFKNNNRLIGCIVRYIVTALLLLILVISAICFFVQLIELSTLTSWTDSYIWLLSAKALATAVVLAGSMIGLGLIISRW